MTDNELDRIVDETVPGTVRQSFEAARRPGQPEYCAALSQTAEQYCVSFLEIGTDGARLAYSESFTDPLAAGEDFGFFKTLLLEEGRLQESGFEPGLGFIESRLRARADAAAPAATPKT